MNKDERKAYDLVGHVYDGTPDARQTAQPTLPSDSGLFRKRYRALSDDEKLLHDRIKNVADELASLIATVEPAVGQRFSLHVPLGILATLDIPNTGTAERIACATLAIRHLEDAVYRAIKALTG